MSARRGTARSGSATQSKQEKREGCDERECESLCHRRCSGVGGFVASPVCCARWDAGRKGNSHEGSARGPSRLPRGSGQVRASKGDAEDGGRTSGPERLLQSRRHLCRRSGKRKAGATRGGEVQ